ncbi:hypothetical protein Tcan_09632 [Toxocara canis]|uniref:BPTI/Kunitz inhibitor domain-containing protein n=1 Tax=Toxocara canis TaxID=6265 RepID=A0A0B2V930_TOXCA|nr:hypothetical protein Tcan_09632 [Toxocara canis]
MGIFSVILRITTVIAVVAIDGGSEYCGGKNYALQPVKYYYSEEHQLCYGFRDGCQSMNISTIYDDLQTCMDHNFTPGTVKFVELTCALRALGVVVDENDAPLLTALCFNNPGGKFCPPRTFCHQSMRYNYSFCCARGLPHNSLFVQLYARNETADKFMADYYYY